MKIDQIRHFVALVSRPQNWREGIPTVSTSGPEKDQASVAIVGGEDVYQNHGVHRMLELRLPADLKLLYPADAVILGEILIDLGRAAE